MFGVWLVGVLCLVGVCSGRVTKVTRLLLWGFVVFGVVLCLVRVFTVVPGFLPSIEVALTL